MPYWHLFLVLYIKYGKICVTQTRQIENLSFPCKFNVYWHFCGVIYHLWKTKLPQIENPNFTYKINVY